MLGRLFARVGCCFRSSIKCMSTAAPAQLTPKGNPLPKTIHQTLPSSTTSNKRLLIVGDVHGCNAELTRLMQLCSFSPDTTVLIQVGDLVNKGPDSLATIDLLRQSNGYVARGNHDEAAVAAYRAYKNTGQQYTGKPVFEWVTQLDEDTAMYLQDLPFSLTIEAYNILIIHAGLLPTVKLADQDLSHLITMRDILITNPNALQAVEKPVEGGRPWASVYKGEYGHVFFGHDAKRGLQIEPHATGLDGGCVYGKKLYGVLLPALDDAGNVIHSSNSEFNSTDGTQGTVQDIDISGVDGESNKRVIKGWLLSVDAARVYSAPKTTKTTTASNDDE